MSEAKSAQPMSRVLVTGAAGMLGFHLRCRLHVLDEVEVRLADREEFADPDTLHALVSDVDAVVHLAGINRGSDFEVEEGNLAIAQTLVDALQRSGGQPQVVYSSSTHFTRDTPYGRSKKRAGEILRAQCGGAVDRAGVAARLRRVRPSALQLGGAYLLRATREGSRR